MPFIEEDWWKDTKWFKLFVAGCVVALLAFCLVYNLFLKPDLDSIEKNFGVSVPTSGAVQLYSHNTQGWFGDGEDYSVWQYQNPDELMHRERQEPVSAGSTGLNDLSETGDDHRLLRFH